MIILSMVKTAVWPKLQSIPDINGFLSINDPEKTGFWKTGSI